MEPFGPPSVLRLKRSAAGGSRDWLHLDDRHWAHSRRDRPLSSARPEQSAGFCFDGRTRHRRCIRLDMDWPEHRLVSTRPGRGVDRSHPRCGDRARHLASARRAAHCQRSRCPTHELASARITKSGACYGTSRRSEWNAKRPARRAHPRQGRHVQNHHGAPRHARLQGLQEPEQPSARTDRRARALPGWSPRGAG